LPKGLDGSPKLHQWRARLTVWAAEYNSAPLTLFHD
jgi:hypothetical protein